MIGNYAVEVDARFRDVSDDSDDPVMEETGRDSLHKKFNDSKAIACLSDVALIRHPLMEGKVTPETEKLQTELEIDKKLGLKAQAAATSQQALAADINELTKSNNYFQVSKSLLEKLFQISSLRMMCWNTNVNSFFRALFPDCLLPLFMSLASILSIPLVFFAGAKTFNMPCTWISVSASTGVIIAAAGILVLGGFAIYHWSQMSISWDVIDVKLDSQILSDVTDKIPLGAKMKVLEAKESGIFEDFVYVHPLFGIQRKTIDINKYMPHINIDPAILGVTKDKRMYMIVYWDVKKDVEHVIKQITDFKSFKLES